MTDPVPEPAVFDEDADLEPQIQPATDFPTEPPTAG